MNASKICKTFDVVVVPFPFTDNKNWKNRPAVVVSSFDHFNKKCGCTVLMMITSSATSWPLDVEIIDLESSGLSHVSLVRMKCVCVDNRFIYKKIGHLGCKDAYNVQKSFKAAFQDMLK